MAFEGDDDLEDDPTPINRKSLVRRAGRYQVYIDERAVPFHTLDDDALLDTADLCELFGCSARTVYRWVAERGLVPAFEGRAYLFAKGQILDWWEDNRPPLGRPPGS